jgi:polyhydroxyalkanoate synthase
MSSELSSVPRIYYVALRATLSQRSVCDRANASYRIIASGPYWRLRHYGTHDTPDPLLIIAAPIKRPYLWDLAPPVSVIRHLLQQRLDVHLLEWLPASSHTGNNGLEEYTLPISECIQRIGA